MINYRLLRDNKESGPYSEEELIAKGFKPYDLLWAEGKTAGWQYPSEIAAFKRYAPIVEEQPYDRFYKKQSAQKTVVADNRNSYSSYSSYQSGAVKENNQPKEVLPPAQPIAARPLYDYNIKDLPARHIHVTLPSGNTVNLTNLVSKKENKESIENNGNPGTGKKENFSRTEEQRPAAFADSTASTAKTITASTTLHMTTQAFPANTAGKEQVDHLPVYQAVQTRFSWTLVAGAAIGVATMVGLGIMIGLSINREKNEAAFNEAIARRTKSVQQPFHQSVSNKLPVVPVTATNEPVSANPEQASKKDLVQHTVAKNLPNREEVKENKKIMAADKPLIEKNNIVQNTDLSLQHITVPVTTGGSTIGKKLSLQENDFKAGAFGGISNLKLTLVNGSSLPLESVQVEIDYILANKKIYKTEIVLFKDVAAGAQATVDAPASSRGIKITSRITKITAKEAGLPGTAATVKS
jgi:hypothetical protein